jgi:hypothetical protein
VIRLLKEWNVIERALEDGRQILLARKGGLLDEGERFVPAYKEFFVYPTLFHQSQQVREALKPSELLHYDRLISETALEASDRISIRLFCRVITAYEVATAKKLAKLNQEHLWNTPFLERRFEAGREKGLTLLVVRAYRLDPPAPLYVNPAYAGCKSWIEAKDTELTSVSLVPVLSDDEFLRRRLRVERALS